MLDRRDLGYVRVRECEVEKSFRKKTYEIFLDVSRAFGARDDWRWLEMVGKSRESIGRSGWGCGVGGMGVLDGERIDQPTTLAGVEM